MCLPSITGCAGVGGETSGLTIPPVSLPKLDLPNVELPKVDLTKVELPKVELPEAVPPVTGHPTDVYTRIARGALTCWFGASGPLKARYIYNADAESPARGGRATIVVHERDAAAKDPRGPRAFKIDIEPEGETAKVGFDNFTLPPETARSVKSDIDRWAADRMGCQPAAPVQSTATVVAKPPAPVAAPPASRTPTSAKRQGTAVPPATPSR